MTHFALASDRFGTEDGFRVLVQVPAPSCPGVVDRILAETALAYGDYDCVTFRTATGTQQFRSTGAGRNPAMKEVAQVPCVELSFFLSGSDTGLVQRVLEAIYDAHPYEEPVIFLSPCTRSLHIRGRDEDNPNRFWNAPPAEWVPDEHR